jgi:hypothetical protein
MPAAAPGAWRSMLDQLPGLRSSLRQACAWLTDVAQIRTPNTGIARHRHMQHTSDWRGAMRGEYYAASQRWDFMCPVWHTAQACKALVQAHHVLGDDALLAAAQLAGDFVLRQQIRQGPDEGLLLAYEDQEHQVNTSALLEALDGMFVLSEATGDARYRDAALAAGRWSVRKAWVPGEGVVLDLYDPQTMRFIDPAYVTLSRYPGRPLADDAVWLTCYELTGEPVFAEAFDDVLACLLRTEHPAGNWLGYGPCQPQSQLIHPRHAYWWGRPLLLAYRRNALSRHLEAACRSGHWYIQAQRQDGGMFRDTGVDFRTPSFGHATSGIVCAAIFWMDLLQTTGDRVWMEPTVRAMQFAMRMQLTQPRDANLRGAILEKVLPPDGTDASPYHLRDLGTIFFVQAAAQLLAHAND